MRQTVIARQRIIAALGRANKALTVAELELRTGKSRNTVQQQLYGLIDDGVAERTHGVDDVWRYKLTGAPLPDSPSPERLAGNTISRFDHRRLAAALGAPSGAVLRGAHFVMRQSARSRIHRFGDGS